MAPPQLLQGDAFRDCNNTGPRASHSFPAGGVFSVFAETHIAAPPKAVYDTLLDIQHWKDWNTFVYDVTITSHPHSHTKTLHMEEETIMVFHVNMTDTNKTKSNEMCNHIEQLRTRANHAPPCITHIRWSLHNASIMLPGFLIKSEKTCEIEEAEDGTTMFRTWHNFGGWVAKTVKKRYEQALKDRSQEMCNDMKKYVEEKQKGGKAQGALGNSDANTELSQATDGESKPTIGEP